MNNEHVREYEKILAIRDPHRRRLAEAKLVARLGRFTPNGGQPRAKQAKRIEKHEDGTVTIHRASAEEDA